MALQTKTFTKAGDKGYGLKLVLTENSTNVTSNTSQVAYSFYITRGGMGFFASQPFSWNIVIGGQTISVSNFKFRISTSDPDEQLIKSGTVTVSHNGDGSKTMSFDVSTPDATWIAPTNAPTAMRMTGSWELTTIPRASSISAINADIGSDTLITISRASSAFTHTVTYKFGSLSGTITTKTSSTSIPWEIPTSFYAQIPKAKYGNVTLTCQTYSGSTLVGTKTTTFRATASEALCEPTVSGDVVSTDTLSKTLTGGTSKLIRYVSTARTTITASAKNSATIASRTVNGKATTGTLDFVKVETGKFVFAATDGRGYTGSATVNSDVVQYIPLTLTPIVARLTPTGDTVKVSLKGNFWPGNFGAVENALTISYQYKKDGGAWSEVTPITGAVISGNSYTVSAEVPGIDYREPYLFRFAAQDKAVKLTQDVPLSQGIPVYEWGKNDFRFHVPVIAGGRTVQVNSDGGIPVLYLSRDNNILGGFSLSNSTNRLYLFSRAANTGKDENYVIDPADPNLAAAKSYYLLTSKIAPDYVIATGATNNWRWRKWKSGLAECWKRLTVTIKPFVFGNGIYYADMPTSRQTLPFTFTDTPKVIVQKDSYSYDAWLSTWSSGGTADTTHTGAYRLIRNIAAEGGPVILNYYVQGFYT